MCPDRKDVGYWVGSWGWFFKLFLWAILELFSELFKDHPSTINEQVSQVSWELKILGSQTLFSSWSRGLEILVSETSGGWVLFSDTVLFLSTIYNQFCQVSLELKILGSQTLFSSWSRGLKIPVRLWSLRCCGDVFSDSLLFLPEKWFNLVKFNL